MALQLTPWDNVTSFVDKEGRLNLRAQKWLQDALQQIYDEVGALAAAQAAEAAAELANTAAETAQMAADNANTAAGTAQTAATTAQGAAEDAAAKQALASSGVTGLTMLASDEGADASITISAHTRVYGDGATVAVNGGVIAGLSYTTEYFVYYSDLDREGGVVTYQASTDPDDAIQVGSIHSVGDITTPAPAGPPEPGIAYPPPGIIVKRP